MTSTALALFPDYSPASETQSERHSPHGEVPSILKWTGSKRSQARDIAAIAPSHDRYFEPFLGGGALMYLLAQSNAYGSDVYPPLIAYWLKVRDDPDYLIEDYRRQWTALQDDLPAYYYVVRDRFNLDQRPEDLNFLMRTCVNGIVRFSRRGDFNNSFHLSRKGMLPGRFEKIVRAWTLRLRDVHFQTCDYREALSGCRAGDFVYLDPPYAGNKQRYVSDLDLDGLYAELERLNSVGAKWALSFDGSRGDRDYEVAVPKDLFRRKVLLVSGLSAVSKVLNGPLETVSEGLYLNY
jgi:DNA adenine methylase